MIRAAPASAALLLLSACSGEPEKAASPAEIRAAAGEPAATAARPEVAAQLIEQDNDLLDFSYGWPAEAAAIAGLNARFSAEAAERLAGAAAFAREDREGRGPDAPYHGHYFKQDWVVAGDAERLLSLAAEVATFTGGAHGNSQFEAILWDRATNAEIELADIFRDADAAFAAMTPTYCRGLDEQRAEKRGEALPLQEEGWMTECDSLAEATVAPVDADGDGRFDLFRVLIAPYEAGPYAEGSYEVDIPVTDEVRAMVQPGFGGSF